MAASAEDWEDYPDSGGFLPPAADIGLHENATSFLRGDVPGQGDDDDDIFVKQDLDQGASPTSRKAGRADC